MSIVLARIDNRLIHGQVLEAWVPHCHANCIVVANDQLAQSGLQRAIMEAAVPRSLEVIIDSVAAVAQRFLAGGLATQRVLLLFASSDDALQAHRCGLSYLRLNLGNMHAEEGKQQFSCTIAMDAADIDNLRLLEGEGVDIVSQCVPTDRELDWKKLMRITGR